MSCFVTKSYATVPKRTDVKDGNGLKVRKKLTNFLEFLKLYLEKITQNLLFALPVKIPFIPSSHFSITRLQFSIHVLSIDFSMDSILTRTGKSHDSTLGL